MTEKNITDILKTALDEDLGAIGDITSMAIFDETDTGEAEIRSKQAGVLSGASLIAPLFALVDSFLPTLTPPSSTAKGPKTKTEIYLQDGSALKSGTVICKISGPMRTILAGERTILNLLQRLSGIATATAEMVNILKNSDTRLLDTRKTTPGLRMLEKAAVRHGGGVNHRFGLYDMILIKDTHVKRAGGVRAALEKAFAWRGDKKMLFIEVEVQSTAEFLEALALGPDRIMLDNMSPQEMKKCADERNSQRLTIELEASGNVSLDSLPAIAATGVDFVSSGAITHSAAALDMNLIVVS